jgi:uncharacterized iron-regulated protein
MTETQPIGAWIEPASGRRLDHGPLLARLARRQAVLLGETHDRADIHRWQLHVLTGLLAHRSDIVVGFEMFPRGVQPVLDDWVAGRLTAAAFLERADWANVWGFPAALYQPLFDACRELRLPMVALNCRRALVSEVGQLGWDAIRTQARDGVTPAAPSTPAHRQYLFDMTGGGRTASAADPGFDRFVRAQSTWDRAFACRIAERHAATGALVVGIIGRGHMEYGHGTPFQLADLGVTDVAVLLPSDEAFTAPPGTTPIADAVFRLDRAAERGPQPE